MLQQKLKNYLKNIYELFNSDLQIITQTTKDPAPSGEGVVK